MRAHLAVRVYVFLFVAATARGNSKWDEIHQQGMQAYQQHKLEIAEDLFRKSAELAKDQQEIGTSFNDLGVMQHLQGREAEAKRSLTRGLAAWQQLRAPEPAALTAHALASVNRSLGEYREAERNLRDALATKPQDVMTIAMLHNTLGDLLREQGQFAKAREAALVVTGLSGIPWRIAADAASILADLHRESGDYDASAAAWTTILGEAREQGDKTVEAVAIRGIGESRLAAGDTSSAEPSFRKALAMFESVSDSHQIASTLTCLGELYLKTTKPAMAEDALRRALVLDEAILGSSHPQVAVLLQMRADAASRQGALARARADLERAWLIVKGAFGERSAVSGAFLANRGAIEQRAGNNDAAVASYEQAMGILQSAGAEARTATAAMLTNYAAALRTLNRKSEAKAILSQAKSFR